MGRDYDLDAPFVPAARKLLSELSELGIRASQWTDFIWDVKNSESKSELRLFVPNTTTRQLGMGLPRSAWVRINHLRTGVGRFQSSMHKRGLVPTSTWECGALDQRAAHVILDCPLHRAPRGYRGLLILDNETRCWLNNIAASIWRGLPSTRRRRIIK